MQLLRLFFLLNGTTLVNTPKYFEKDETSICSTVRPSIIKHGRPARNQLLVDVLAQMLANWCSGIFYRYWMLKVQNVLLQHLRNLGTAEPRIIPTLHFMSYYVIWTAKLWDHFDLTFHHEIVPQACWLHCNQLGKIQSVRPVSEWGIIHCLCLPSGLAGVSADTTGSSSVLANKNFLTILRTGWRPE
jgi:hypothetical protein